MDTILGQPRISKALIDTVNNLRDIGLSGLDLPRVSLIGLRNAKADILEAILGFKTDKSRHACSFEYRLSRARSPWSCKISVRFASEASGQLQDVSILPFGDTIANKDEVQAMMTRAHFSALNPSVAVETALTMPQGDVENYLATNSSLSCSHNTVCLELSGATLPDLTFLELPDLDFTFELEARKVIESVILAELQGKCLVLAAVPMNEDIFSRRALHLAKSVDPDGIRTIGILTNVSEENIQNYEGTLQHGYYRIEARGRESVTSTGSQKPPGRSGKSKSLPPSEHDDDAGRLVNALCSLLPELIRETLPVVRVDVLHSLDQCRQEISSLPPPITEPATYMLVILTRLSEDMQQVLHGSRQLSPLMKQVHESYVNLGLVLKSTAPNFVPVLRSIPVTKEMLDWLSTDEPDESAMIGPLFYLDDMRKHIAMYATHDRPHHVPYQAEKTLISSFQDSWPSIVSECLENVVGSIVKVIIERIQVICEGHELLAEHLRSLLGDLIRHHLDVCSEYLQTILEIELTPYTQHQNYLSCCSEAWLSTYRDIRKANRATTTSTSYASVSQSKRNLTASTSQVDNRENKGLRPSFTCRSPSPASLSQVSDSSVQSSSSNSGYPKLRKDPPTTNDAPSESNTSEYSVINVKVNSTSEPSGSPDPGESSGNPSILVEPPLVLDPVKPGVKPVNPEKPQASKGVSLDDGSADASKLMLNDAYPLTRNLETDSPSSDTTGPEPSVSKDPDTDYQIALAALSRLGFTGLTKNDLEKLETSDEYEDELKLMADVRGYFQIAYTRVADYAPALIDLKFVRAVGSDILPFFMKKMGLGRPNANGICEMYFTEDLEVAVKRASLDNLLGRLERAQLELFKLGL